MAGCAIFQLFFTVSVTGAWASLPPVPSKVTDSVEDERTPVPMSSVFGTPVGRKVGRSLGARNAGTLHQRVLR